MEWFVYRLPQGMKIGGTSIARNEWTANIEALYAEATQAARDMGWDGVEYGMALYSQEMDLRSRETRRP